MRNGKKVGFTSVVGDLFHAGHVAMIQECKQHCDYLIVGVMCGVHDRQGKNEPIQSVFERMYQVKHCEGVDDTIALGSERDLDLCIKTLAPSIDVRFVGSDYIGRDFTAKHTCEELGIPIMYTSREHGLSSTELRKRIEKEKV